MCSTENVAVAIYIMDDHLDKDIDKYIQVVQCLIRIADRMIHGPRIRYLRLLKRERQPTARCVNPRFAANNRIQWVLTFR